MPRPDIAEQIKEIEKTQGIRCVLSIATVNKLNLDIDTLPFGTRIETPQPTIAQNGFEIAGKPLEDYIRDLHVTSKVPVIRIDKFSSLNSKQKADLLNIFIQNGLGTRLFVVARHHDDTKHFLNLLVQKQREYNILKNITPRNCVLFTQNTNNMLGQVWFANERYNPTYKQSVPCMTVGIGSLRQDRDSIAAFGKKLANTPEIAPIAATQETNSPARRTLSLVATPPKGYILI